MQKFIYLPVFIFVFAACALWSPAFGQNPPASDPFRISPGKFFSASKAGAAPNVESSRHNLESVSENFREALRIINENHADSEPKKNSELVKSSISGMLHALDPHSNYFDTSEFDQLTSEQNSEYFGIGATIANYRIEERSETFVTSTYPDSPAFRAGLRFGDKIVEVDGESVSEKSALYVRNKIRGAKGTVVRIKIEREKTSGFLNVSMRRNRVPQPSIPDAYILSPGVGYIDLSNGFNYTTLDELNVALVDLEKRGMKSLVLDLRGNPGGILEQAVRVAEKFLPHGRLIVSQRGRFVLDNQKWTSKNKKPIEIPLVVLVNGDSASASEIVAGALQDYDRAFIVGEKTFGKGLVQSIINLPHGAGLTLTTAKYYTPSGRSIQRNYSGGNLYDYYRQKIDLTEKQKQEFARETLSGRPVFGGDGINPDERVEAGEFSPAQIDLLDVIFSFSREVAGGRIAGFESYRISQQKEYGARINKSDYPVGAELFEKFLEFAEKYKFSKGLIKREKKFIEAHIRYNLISAAFGSVAANQVLAERDEQIRRAVEVLPKASRLAQAANRKIAKTN